MNIFFDIIYSEGLKKEISLYLDK